jgi:hypothetical protein
VEVFGKGRGEYTLPCGYVDAEGKVHRKVILREMSGEEEDLMDDDEVSVSERHSRILAACCEKLGTVDDKKIIGSAISDTLERGLPITSSDRIAMLLYLRRCSVGEVYKFSRRCPRCGYMNKGKILDLRTIEITYVDEERAAKRRVEVELPRSGKKVILRVLSAATEVPVVDLRPNQKDLRSVAILARIDTLDGE